MGNLLQYQALAFVPLVTAVATPVYVTGENPEPISIQSYQYQAKAEPVFTPSAPTETVTSDKWAQPIQIPTLRIKRRQDTNSSFVQIVAAPTATPVYVSSQSSEPISIQSFQYPARTAPVLPLPSAPETVTADKWLTSWPQPYPARKRLAQYGSNTSVAGEDEILTGWIPPTEQPQRRIQSFRDRQGALQITISAPAETITSDKWAQPIQVPVRDRRLRNFQQFSADAQLHIPPPFEIIRVDKWKPVYPDQHLRVRQPVQRGWYVKDLIPRAETSLLTKFIQPIQQPRRDIIRWQYRYPFFSAENLFNAPFVSSAPAIWRNEATISLVTVDLESLSLTVQHSQTVSLVAVDLAALTLVTENTQTLSLTTKHERSVSIVYEHVRTI